MFRNCLSVCLALMMAIGPTVAWSQEPFNPADWFDDPTMGDDFPLPLDDDLPGVHQSEIDLLKSEVETWEDIDRLEYAWQLEDQLVWLLSLYDQATTQDQRDRLDQAVELNGDAYNRIYGFGGACDDNDRAARRLELAEYWNNLNAGYEALQNVNEAYEYLELRAHDEWLADGWYWEAEWIAYEVEMEILDGEGDDGLVLLLRPESRRTPGRQARDRLVMHDQPRPSGIVRSPGTADPVPVITGLARLEPAGLKVHRTVPIGVWPELAERGLHG